MIVNSINSQYQNKNCKRSDKNYTAQKNNTPSFKGGAADVFKSKVSEPVVNGLSKFYTGLAKTKPFQKFVAGFSKSNNTFTHLLIGESIFLSGFYMINTLKNKKIEKEQKPQMIINDALTLGVSCAGAYFAEDKITNLVKKGSEKYFQKHSDFYTELGKKALDGMKDKTPQNALLEKVSEVASSSGEKLKQGLDDVANMMKGQLKNVVGEKGKLKTFQVASETMDNVTKSVKEAVVNNQGNAKKAVETVKGLVDDVYTKSAARTQAENTFVGINKLKVLVIFGIIYRYLGPVVITPVANKISAKLFSNEPKDKEAANKTQKK